MNALLELLLDGLVEANAIVTGPYAQGDPPVADMS